MPSLQKGNVNKSEIRILLDNGQIEEALYLLRSDPSKRKDLEQIRLEEDYITRIRVLGILQELGEPITLEELEPLFDSEEDEAVIGAALLMSNINGAKIVQELIESIPLIVRRLLEEDYEMAKDIAEINGWDEYFPELRDPMIILWAIVLALGSQGRDAITPIQTKMTELIAKNGLEEYSLIETINTLKLALHLIGEEGIHIYNEIKRNTTKETFFYYEECFSPVDLYEFAKNLNQILTRNPTYALYPKKILAKITLPREE